MKPKAIPVARGAVALASLLVCAVSWAPLSPKHQILAAARGTVI